MNLKAMRLLKNVPVFFLLFLFFVSPLLAYELKTEKYFNKKINCYVDVAAGEILVKFKPTVSASVIAADTIAANVQIIRSLPGNVRVLSAAENQPVLTVEQLLDYYKKNPKVEYAEPNFIYRAFSTTPNDPDYPKQWGLPMIKADQGWDITKGTIEVTVAVLDTGVSKTHPDITTEVGYNYYDNNNNPNDDNGHGTHVAGIIAATTNNSVGMAGVNWYCKILPVKVLGGPRGEGTNDMIANGIRYAADQGAKVINMSLGSSSESTTINEAVQYAYGKGCVQVGAAGNSGNSDIEYPASHDNVISVAALNYNGTRGYYSNYNNYVTVAAPGGSDDGNDAHDVWSCWINNSYEYKFGTSMATPHVAGLAALLFAKNPTWTNTQVLNRITSEADHLGTAGRNPQYGYGCINVYNALLSAPVTTEITGTIKIDDGASYTNEVSVLLTISATYEGGISQMRFSNDNATWSVAETYATSKTWTLSAGEGTKIVYAKFRDNASNWSTREISAAIVYKTGGPAAPTVTTLVSPTNVSTQTIAGTEAADAVLTQVNGSTSEVTHRTPSWSYRATLVAGTNTFEIKSLDGAGNVSAVTRAYITLEAVTYSNPSLGITIVFPVGASSQIVTITPETYASPESLGTYPPGLRLSGSAINYRTNVSTFTLPITITMRYSSTDSTPVPYYWDTTTSSWSTSGITVISRTADTVTFTTTHLSIYGIFAVSGSLDSVLVYPNPYRTGSGAGVYFAGLVGTEQIRIYTLDGNLVRSFNANGSTSYNWNSSNTAGNQCAPGVYLYVITNASGQKKVGKLALIN